MDFLVATAVAQRGAAWRSSGGRREKYEGEDADERPRRAERQTGPTLLFWLVTLLWLLLFGAPAAYLSWSSNSLIGWHWLMKAFFAFFAFTNGFWYLISHLIHKVDLIRHIRARAL